MTEEPDLTFLLRADSPWLEVEFAVGGQEFFVRRSGDDWVVGQEADQARGPVSAVALAPALNQALAELERRRLANEPHVEQR